MQYLIVGWVALYFYNPASAMAIVHYGANLVMTVAMSMIDVGLSKVHSW
jgi:hypothetical protein